MNVDRDTWDGVIADIVSVLDHPQADGNAALAVQTLILVELRLIRAELVKANARGGALVSSGL